MTLPTDLYLVWRVATEPVPGCEPVAVLSRADDAARMAAALCADEERTRPPHGIARATYHVAPVAFIPSAPGPGPKFDVTKCCIAAQGDVPWCYTT